MSKKYVFQLVFSLILIVPHTIKCTSFLPEPYKSVTLLTPDYFMGWFSHANRRMLKEFIETKKPQVIVEVGSWLGASTIFMAELLPEQGKVYAIDHWQGSPEHYADNDLQRRLPTLYQQFLSNVIHRNQAQKIIPLRMSSLEAASTLNVYADLIYIDGSHQENDVYNDIMAWYPKLAVNGILCGDDYAWGNDRLGYVKNGVHKAAKQLNLKVNVVENVFWYFEAKK